jgi:hypothetical protein
MYCPACGSEERQPSQYCRACGTDLRVVRVSLERPDSVTASAITAREEIGRAVADKIREVEGSRDLKRIAEDVLPQIEKFLKSPDEKRLRRMRAGVITASIGFGAIILSLIVLATIHKDDVISMFTVLIGLAIVTFMIGLGLVINGLLFTKARQELADRSSDAKAQNALDGGAANSQPALSPGTTAPGLRVPSITEHTTHQLKVDR